MLLSPKSDVISKAIDMLVDFCFDNDIDVSGMLVFTENDESFIEYIPPAEAEDEESLSPYK